MTLLTIAQSLAKDVGVAVPTSLFGSSDRTMIEMIEVLNAAGEEVARRVDWPELREQATLTGDGTSGGHTAPPGFSRPIPGLTMVDDATGETIRPLSLNEWTMTPVEGTPRYFFYDPDASATGVVYLWPFLANAATATLTYLSENFSNSGQAKWSADDDLPKVSEDLILKCATVRWRRQKGMDYADHEAEYEAALSDIDGFRRGYRP